MRNSPFCARDLEPAAARLPAMAGNPFCARKPENLSKNPDLSRTFSPEISSTIPS